SRGVVLSHVYDHVGNDNCTCNWTFLTPDTAHANSGVKIYDFLDFFWMHLEAANIDDAVPPSHEVSPAIAQLDQIVRIDKAIRIAYRPGRVRNVAQRRARRFYSQRSVQNFRFHRSILTSENIGGKSRFAIRNLEGQPGLRRGESMRNVCLRKSAV